MSNERPTLADQLSGNLPILSSTARTAFVASHFILAMGSGAVIMYFIVSKLSGNLAPWMCYVLAWAGSLVWYSAVENPLRKFILFAWAYRLADKDEAANLSENMKRTGKASWHVTLLLLVATLSLSVFVNFDIAEAVTVEQDSTAEIEHANKLTGSYDRDVEILREQVAAAPEVDRLAVAQAKKDAARWKRAAQDVQGSKMGDLIRSGNGWAYKQLSRKQRAHLQAEIKRGEEHIANAATLPRLQSELNEYIRTHSIGRDTVQAMTAGVVAARSEAYKGTLSRRNLMLLVAVFIVVFVFVYTARLLVLACLETGENLEDDPGEGVAKVAARLVGKANAKLGATLSEKWGDKLAVAPASAPTGLTPIAPTAKPETPSSANLSASLASPLPVAPTTLPTSSVPTPTVVPTTSPTKTTPAPKMPTKTQKKVATKPSAKSAAKVAVTLVGTGDKAEIIIDDKSYTPRKAADRISKFYKQSKSAAKKGTRESNRLRYEQCRDATTAIFIFEEKDETVSITQI